MVSIGPFLLQYQRMKRTTDRLQQSSQSEVIDKILREAESGNADALFQRGLWQLAGRPLIRNLGAARNSFQQAAAAGHQDAMLIDIALTANGSGGDEDWQRAWLLLDRAALVSESARHIQSLLTLMTLQPDGSPAKLPLIENLTSDRAVRRVRHCLSMVECAHLANAADDLLAPAFIADPLTGRNVPHPIRTSDAATLPPIREDLVIRAINHRIAAISNTLINQGEALTILRYQQGQQFRLHSDALPNVRNQRIKTVLLYLNEGYVGGETTFPEYGLTITPAAGDAIIFDNTFSDGLPNPRMRHAGLPVLSGAKWLATRWIRSRPFNVWNGPESV